MSEWRPPEDWTDSRPAWLRRWHDIPHRLRRTRRRFRAWRQRLTRGFAQEEVWSLNAHLAKWTLPRLRALREGGPGSYPMGMEHAEWQVMLDEMIYALDVAVRDEFGDYDEVSDAEREDMRDPDGRFERGLELFGEHWRNLWD